MAPVDRRRWDEGVWSLKQASSIHYHSYAAYNTSPRSWRHHRARRRRFTANAGSQHPSKHSARDRTIGDQHAGLASRSSRLEISYHSMWCLGLQLRTYLTMPNRGAAGAKAHRPSYTKMIKAILCGR